MFAFLTVKQSMFLVLLTFAAKTDSRVSFCLCQYQEVITFVALTPAASSCQTPHKVYNANFPIQADIRMLWADVMLPGTVM